MEIHGSSHVVDAAPTTFSSRPLATSTVGDGWPAFFPMGDEVHAVCVEVFIDKARFAFQRYFGKTKLFNAGLFDGKVPT